MNDVCVASEYAELPLIPPYLHPGYHDHQYIYGVNFASSGAGDLPETNPGLVIDLKTQALYFAQVGKLLRKILGEEKAKKLLSTAVYIFSVGTNDYAVPFYTNSNGTVVLPYPQQIFIDLVICNITTAIKVHLNFEPMASQLPMLVLKNKVLHLQGYTIILFPKSRRKLEKQLIKEFNYSILNFYDALLELMKYPSKYGSKEGNVACCGGGPYMGDYSCGGKREIEEYELCNNVDEYVFFDSPHPTESTAEHFAQLMWNGNKDVIDFYNLKQLFHVESIS
ncbi:GDSL esterase/lipase 5-like [Glycine soja]|nr:GDSL esterase/lipase 5-like [Glycine soja]